MTSSSVDLLCVHGFLGLPSDFDTIVQQWKKHHVGQVHAVNLWELLDGEPSLETLAQKIAPHITDNTVALGYSLGGRALLHLPVEAHHRLRALVLISSHFGLSSEAEKNQRLKADQIWADRFCTEPWPQLMIGWNNQAVFAGDRDRLERFEKNYSRIQLRNVILGCSLGRQKDLLKHDAIDFKKVLFIHGDKDTKYSESVKNWKTEQPALTVQTVPGGHFPLVNSAEHIARRSSTFYRNLMKSSQID